MNSVSIEQGFDRLRMQWAMRGWTPLSNGLLRIRAGIAGHPIRAYWWSDVPNFGDRLTPLLLQHFGFAPIHSGPEGAEIAASGSILQNLPEDYRGIILGAGFVSANKAGRYRRATILALRGKLTRAIVAPDRAVALGDPGLLASELVPIRPVKRTVVGIVPHYLDRWNEAVRALRKRHGAEIRIIDPTWSPLTVVRAIGSCECILSSSLHGIVAADSLGIPNRWLTLSSNVFGGRFKFDDYHSALGLTQEPASLSGRESVSELVALTEMKPVKEVAKVKSGLLGLFRSLKEVMTR